VRLWCVAGLLLFIFIVLGPAPQEPHAAIIPVAAGGRTASILSLPYRVPTAQVKSALEVTALNLLNRERMAAGLPALMPHAGIRAAARGHGKELFANGYLSHRSRDGRWPDQRVKGLGVRVSVVGENLAYAGDVREAHQTLVASAAHRKNMLSPRYRRTGIAVLDGGAFGVIVVQDFSD
jgi:uncharacterized protein YkwD